MAKAITVRGRMKDEDEQCLQGSLTDIEECVEANHVVTHLFAANVITFDDKIEITSTEPRKKRIRLLVDKLILHGGTAGFVELIKALEKSHYLEIAEKLIKCGCSCVADNLGDDIKNWKRGSNIERRLELLRERIFQMEAKMTQNESMKEDILAIKSVLKEVKDLSRLGAETKITIETLTQQLQEKTKKLEEAEKQIARLEGKIKDLEDERKKDKMEIKNLKGSVVKQEFTITGLKKQVNEQNDQIEDKGRAIVELEKKDVDKELRLERLENLLVNNQNIPYVSRYRQKRPNKTIKPRNRFE